MPLTPDTVSALAFQLGIPVVHSEDYQPYDQGIRHIATLAGYLSYGLMALTIGFGILTATGWAKRMISRNAISSTHIVLAVTALAFGTLHGMSYIFQTGENFGLINAIVPFVAGGEVSVGLGIVGLDLGLAVALSIVVQRKLGYRRWHIVHYFAYGAFALSLIHTFMASPEVQSFGILGVGVIGLAAACLLVFILRVLPATTAVGLRIAPAEK